MKYFVLAIFVLIVNGCDFKKVDEGNAPAKSAMKCGAGKCGASMFEGNSLLEKKKNNILSQITEGDSRKDCVMNAKSTKEVYDCVRDENGNLTIKDSTSDTPKAKPVMKCAPGRCGAAMNNVTKKEPAMKCAAGKCGAVKIDTH